jgi:hypothetical protein
METLKITATLIDNSGYHQLITLKFPVSWTLEQRESYIAHKQLVEDCSIHVYQSDLFAFQYGYQHVDSFEDEFSLDPEL